MSNTLLTAKKIRRKYDLTKEEFDGLARECLDSSWTNAVVRAGKSVCIVEPIWKAFLLVKSYACKLKLARDHPEKSYSVAYYPRTHADGKGFSFMEYFLKDAKGPVLADWQSAKEARSTYGLSKEDFKSLKDECLSSREWSGAIVLADGKTYVVKPLFARFLMAKSFKDRQNQPQSHAPNSRLYDMADLAKLSEKELVRLMAGLDAEPEQTEEAVSDPKYEEQLVRLMAGLDAEPEQTEEAVSDPKYEELRADIAEIKKMLVELREAEKPKKTRKRVTKAKTKKSTAKSKPIDEDKASPTSTSEAKADAGDATRNGESLHSGSSSVAAELLKEVDESTEAKASMRPESAESSKSTK